MIARLLLLATLVNHAASFTKSDGVIELKNVAEFNKAVDEFDLLVVEFYAPVSTPLEPPCRWSPQRWPPVTTGPASQSGARPARNLIPAMHKSTIKRCQRRQRRP
jgi:hypothetical protein